MYLIPTFAILYYSIGKYSSFLISLPQDWHVSLHSAYRIPSPRYYSQLLVQLEHLYLYLKIPSFSKMKLEWFEWCSERLAESFRSALSIWSLKHVLSGEVIRFIFSILIICY